MADISVNLGNKFLLKTPIIAASGTYGYVDEFSIFCDVKNIGAISTKGITIEPRLGNDGDRIFETTGGMINRIGLENVGIKRFIEEKLPALKNLGINYILNAAGSTYEDYFELAKLSDDAGIKAIELNVSCPNVKSGCLEFGTSPESLKKLVEGVRKNYKGYLIVKLTPNVTEIEPLAIAAQEGGADALSAINTVRGLGVELKYTNGKFYKKTVQGGLSGKCIKPVALLAVSKISKVVNIPVIGLGGIATLDDMLEFFSVGAQAVQIGTQNFVEPDVCERLALELNNFMDENGFKNLQELKESLRSK